MPESEIVDKLPLHQSDRAESMSHKLRVDGLVGQPLEQFGVQRGLSGDYPQDYADAQTPYTPAWQEQYTGVGRNTVIQLAREFAGTAEKTYGANVATPNSRRGCRRA